MQFLRRGTLSSWALAVLIGGAFLVLALIATQAPSRGVDTLAVGESETLRARVVAVLDQGTIDLGGGITQPYQRLQLEFGRGPLRGQRVVVEHGVVGLTNQALMFQVGDTVLVEHTRAVDGEDLFVITDFVRTRSLVWLTVLFVALTLLVSRWQGIRSLLSMGLSVAVILGLIVPQIVAGRDPVLVTVVGATILMAISLYLVYGWQPKTHAALAGLGLSLVLTGLLAMAFVQWGRYSGYGTEEAGFLVAAGVQLDLPKLLLAGIILGALGVLDDVAVGQASAVLELHRANPALGWLALFRRGMNIGRDHVSSMVNTLLLAYAGAALPLLLLFSVYTEPLGITLNRELVAEEVVRTLVGSLGLILAVPITSLLASLMARWGSQRGAFRSTE
jgi:uncharacterized membrane protein